jgi:hypothetical protein
MKWTEHVKAFATKNGISYKNALKDSECKELYHKQKGEQRKLITETKNLEANKKLKIY